MNGSMKKSIFLIFIVSYFCGCAAAVAPSVAAIHDAGFSENGRRELLEKELKRFHAALFWDKMDEANSFVIEDIQDKFGEQLRERRNYGRTVTSDIEHIRFRDDAYEAEVDVLVKVLDSHTQLVSPIREKQKWMFTTLDGWQLHELSTVEG